MPTRSGGPGSGSGDDRDDDRRGTGDHVRLLDRDLGGVTDLEGTAGVTLVQADLERADLEAGDSAGRLGPLPADARFAGIIVTNYLHRPLFPALLAALEPGGVLIYETFADGNARFGRPSSPDFLLRRGELLEAVRGTLQVVAFEQGEASAPKPAVVQRICAVAGDDPLPI